MLASSAKGFYPFRSETNGGLNPMKLRIPLIVIAAGLFVSDSVCVYACSCMAPGPPRASLQSAVSVFAGKVTSVKAAEPAGRTISSADPVRVTFEVSRVWKGAKTPTIVAETARDSASCGVSFSTGEEYLVYADGKSAALQVSLCSRTTLLRNAAQDLRELGEGEKPAPPAPSK
jgi:hypothetical protein